MYDPTKSFSNKMRPRKMRPVSNPSVDDNVNSREQQPPLEASRDSSENKIEASSYSPSDDFAEKMSPRKMNRSELTNAQETSPLISSTRAESIGIRMMTVGRGKYYLTLESDLVGLEINQGGFEDG